MATIELAEAGDLTPEAAVANTQAALVFIGNTSQPFAADRRKALLQQLKSLVEDSDFSEAPPFLFETDFGKVAKERLYAGEALKKVSTSSGWARNSFFERSTPKEVLQAHGAGEVAINTAPKAPSEGGTLAPVSATAKPQPRRQGRAAVHQVTPLVHPVATVSTIPVLCTQESKSVINYQLNHLDMSITRSP